MTNPAERDLVVAAFSGGPGVLLENGMTVTQVKEFIARLDVQAYMAVLTEELAAHDALMSRQKFIAKRALSRLVPESVQIIANALRGVVYETDVEGKVKMETVITGEGKNKKVSERPVIKSLPPADYQVDAARDVLDRLGVNEKAQVEAGSSVSVQVLFGNIQKEGVELDYGPGVDSDQKKIMARERVRVVIEKLSGRVAGASQKLKLLEASEGKPASVSAVKKIAKKAVLKAKAKVKVIQ